MLHFNQPIRRLMSRRRSQRSAASMDDTHVHPDEQARLTSLDPQALGLFHAACQPRGRSVPAPCDVRQTNEWDKNVPAVGDLAILKPTARSSESWVTSLGAGSNLRPVLPRPANSRRSPFVERAFFIDGFHCRAACDPDRWNQPPRAPSRSRTLPPSPRRMTRLRRRAQDNIAPRRGDVVPDASFQIARRWDLIHNRQSGISRHCADVRASDGAGSRHPWLGVVDTWHRGAFHELRRRSRSVGEGRWNDAAVLRAQFSGRSALGDADRSGQLMPALQSLQAIISTPRHREKERAAGSRSPPIGFNRVASTCRER